MADTTAFTCSPAGPASTRCPAAVGVRGSPSSRVPVCGTRSRRGSFCATTKCGRRIGRRPGYCDKRPDASDVSARTG